MIPYMLSIMLGILKVMDLKFSEIKVLSIIESGRIKCESRSLIHQRALFRCFYI